MAAPRKHLAYANWPERDRRAWEALFVEGDLFDDRGAACHWRPTTRRSNATHYARWLTWLEDKGALDPSVSPADRVSEERITAFGRDLMSRKTPRTVATSLIGLKCVIKRMAPEQDWRWLMDLTNRLDSWALPSVDHRNRILPADRILRRCLSELDLLLPDPAPRSRAAQRYRDILMIALLTVWPLRIRNFAALRFGEHVQLVGTEWRLEVPGAQTKTSQPVRLVLPELLRPEFEHYLAVVRPALRRPPHPADLWPGAKGSRLSENTIYQTVMRLTDELFGVRINPHSFRSIAATTLAVSSADDALHARPLLGHRLPETTAKHYIKARQLDASRKVSAALRLISQEKLPPRSAGGRPA